MLELHHLLERQFRSRLVLPLSTTHRLLHASITAQAIPVLLTLTVEGVS